MGEYWPDPARYLRWPEQGREAARLLGLMEHLGFASRGERAEFPLNALDRVALQALDPEGHCLHGAYAVVHPGASVPERRWPAARFAAVADALADAGLAVVLTGTGREVDLTTEVAGRMTAPAVNLAGRTGLGNLGALLEGVALLVSNDNGVAHIADGLHLASVTVGPAENHERWEPADRRLHRLLALEASVEMVGREVCELLRERRTSWGFATGEPALAGTPSQGPEAAVA